ncbi:MAG: winged helix-turn-helix transcriptional regulator [Armatimonadetes bacterium]|nr:winged helix-turn-helix transcriptional regulator [Armatimonadota bacterium]
MAAKHLVEKPPFRFYELHAEVCKTLANPLRLQIVDILREGELSVQEIARQTGANLANVSQHLGLMKQNRIVVSRKEGTSIYYRLANPKVLHAFDVMREVLFEQLEKDGALISGFHLHGQ